MFKRHQGHLPGEGGKLQISIVSAQTGMYAVEGLCKNLKAIVSSDLQVA